MKNTILATSIALACFATVAHADYPEVIINSDIVLDYDQYIDMTSVVNVPTSVDLSDTADISVNQFNHDSPISATGGVSNNTMPQGTDGITSIEVNVTAVGNNAAIEVDSANPVIGSVQGNQNSTHYATGNITGNRIDLAQGEIVQLDVTAVGNNLSIDAEDSRGGIELGSIQFNYESGSTAVGSISGNGFDVNAVGRDPVLNVTAVGNNLSVIAPTTGSLTQINRGSAVHALGLISRNTGNVGPVELAVTAVGNNISIKPVGE